MFHFRCFSTFLYDFSTQNMYKNTTIIQIILIYVISIYIYCNFELTRFINIYLAYSDVVINCLVGTLYLNKYKYLKLCRGKYAITIRYTIFIYITSYWNEISNNIILFFFFGKYFILIMWYIKYVLHISKNHLLTYYILKYQNKLVISVTNLNQIPNLTLINFCCN